ncbi:MAG: hypothetical protein ACRD1L_04885 [Terriglobales bacterium]
MICNDTVSSVLIGRASCSIASQLAAMIVSAAAVSGLDAIRAKMEMKIQMRRCSRSKTHALLVIGAIGASLTCAGCWSVGDDAVITSINGATLPAGAPASYTSSEGAHYSWTNAGGATYRYQKSGSDGKVTETGTVRILNIRDTIYAVQSKDDTEDGYNLSLFSISTNGIKPMSIVASDENRAEDIARTDRITYGDAMAGAVGAKDPGDFLLADSLHGSPENLFKFLKDLGPLHFEASDNP